MLDTKLLEWKSDHGAIYSIVLEGHAVYYRSLTSWEIQSIIDLQKSKKVPMDIEVAGCLMATLSPTPFPEFKRPGTLSALFMEIWNKSLPSEDKIEDVIEQAREWAHDSIDHNYATALSSLLCKVLPSLDLVTLLSTPISKLIKIAALVEHITDTSLLQVEQSPTGALPKVIEGSGISQEEANQASHVLQSALRSFKKTK